MGPKRDSRIHGIRFKRRMKRKLVSGKMTLIVCIEPVKLLKQLIWKQFYAQVAPLAVHETVEQTVEEVEKVKAVEEIEEVKEVEKIEKVVIWENDIKGLYGTKWTKTTPM